jgi:hypothetical protein
MILLFVEPHRHIAHIERHIEVKRNISKKIIDESTYTVKKYAIEMHKHLVLESLCEKPM